MLNNEEMNHGSQNVLGVLTWIGGYYTLLVSRCYMTPHLLTKPLPFKTGYIRDGPFNLKRGGYDFFLKKYSDSQCCWKKYTDFGGGKKK